MKTRYNNMDLNISVYLDQLKNRVYKILPLTEEHNIGLPKYLDALLCELTGGKELLQDLSNNSNYISLLMSLECLKNTKELVKVKSKVFECISVIKKIQDSL